MGFDMPIGFIQLPTCLSKSPTSHRGHPRVSLETQLVGIRAAIAGAREVVDERMKAVQA
jgi:pyrrolidone-carboxylate peptidase